jgi:RimJ/RimL family protein N-acetyltransferase
MSDDSLGNMEIRRAVPEDAGGISSLINSVVEERQYTSLRKFSIDEEREFLESLSERETVFIALINGKNVGIQSITRFAEWSESMDHVGNILTMVLKEHRGQGIGKALASTTLEFARSHGYEKIATYIIEDNLGAIEYYTRLGFKPVGKWTRQVRINGIYHNDIIMELFL